MLDENAALIDFYHDLGWSGVSFGEMVWHSSGCRTYIPLPCHGSIELSDEDRQSLWRAGAWFLRYPVAPEQPSYQSYIFLVEDPDYSWGSLSTKMRTKIRRAFKECRVETVSSDFVQRQRMELIEDTYDRQGRVFNDGTRSRWEAYFAAVDRNPLTEVVGALVGKQLAAFSVILRFRGTAYIEHSFNRRDMLRYHVMNALVFGLVTQVFDSGGIDRISFGMRAVMGDTDSLNEFKKSMGFTRVLIGERIEVNPRLKPFMEAGLARLVNFLARLNTVRSERAKYVHGLMTTYLNQRERGLHPLVD